MGEERVTGAAAEVESRARARGPELREDDRPRDGHKREGRSVAVGTGESAEPREGVSFSATCKEPLSVTRRQGRS